MRQGYQPLLPAQARLALRFREQADRDAKAAAAAGSMAG